GGEQFVPLGLVDLAERAGIEDGGIVDQSVEASESLEGRIDQVRQTLEIGEIRLQRERARRSHAFETVDQGIEFLARTVAMQGEIESCAVKDARDDRADATRCAGDEDDGSGTWHIGHWCYPWVSVSCADCRIPAQRTSRAARPPSPLRR